MSSEKCNYSLKFKPLLESLSKTMAPEEFNAYIQDNFKDADKVFEQWNINNQKSVDTNQTAKKPEVASLNRKIEAQDLGSIQSYYIGEPTAFRQMEHRFKKDIVSKSIFDIDSREFIDISKMDNASKLDLLNKNLTDYKFELINNIRSVITGQTVDVDYTLSGSDFTALIEETKKLFENYNGERRSEIYDDYVILSKFDDLLKQFVPFIKTKPIYENTTNSYTDQYEYLGPNVKHFTSFISSDYADAFKQASDLARVLLDVIPEISQRNVPIPDTSIKLEGFTSAMASLKTALMYPLAGSPMTKLSSELYKGAEIDMSRVLGTYINWISTAKNINDERKSYLITKLRAIKHYIYDSNMNQSVKDMFTAMFFKNVPVKYQSYQYDMDSGKVIGKNLNQSLTNIQKYRLQDVITSSIAVFGQHPTFFADLKSKWGISDENGVITINPKDINSSAQIKYSFENGRYVFKTNDKFDEVATRELIRDLTSYVLPEDFMRIYQQSHEDDKSLFEVFKDVIGLMISTSNPNNNYSKTKGGLFDFSSYHNLLNPIANVLSVVYGSDTVSVIKNLEGNSLPTFQLINLAQNIPAMIHRIKNAEKDFLETKHKARTNIYSDNLIISNDGLIGQPFIRSDIKIGDNTKSPSQLTTNELMQVAILQDFYDKLNDGLILLQPTTFADKNTHFLIPFNIDKVININGREIKFKDAIDKALTGNSSELEQIYGELRSFKIDNLVSNIVNDWLDVIHDVNNQLAIVNSYFKTNFDNLVNLQAYANDLIHSRNPIEVNTGNKIFRLLSFTLDPNDYLQSINKFIADWDLKPSQIQQLFLNVGLDCFEEVHYYKDKKSGKIAINETIYNWKQTFDNPTLTKQRLNTNRYNFVKGLFENGVSFDVHKHISVRQFAASPVGSQWIDKETGKLIYAKTKSGEVINKYNYKDYAGQDIVLNPLLDAYYLSDIILSNEYNSLALGEVYAHPNKNREGTWYQPQYFEFSEANRLIAQNKRAVIMGATHHPFLQGMKYGVASNIKLAVMEDMPGNVFNMFLDDKPIDSMDGSGISSPLQARMENVSLLDAGVGYDKKTIMGDVDAIYGRPTLLKWAVYAMTNTRRRISRKSVASGEKLFAKMHSIPIGREIDIKKYFNEEEDPLYFYDLETSTWKYIRTVDLRVDEQGNYILSRIVQNAKEDGSLLGEEYEETFMYSPETFTLYSIDQLFGGAYAGTVKADSNQLGYSEKNLDLLMKIVCEEDLKDKFIAYAVNKSAIKVGAGNVNSVNRWTDNSTLTTISMSTAFGGVQMNADHEVDDAEVTEMTQMLSSLIENGNSLGFVKEIYQDIGSLVVEALSDWNEAIREKDKVKLYRLLGEALVDAFIKNDRDTIGLAQSFVTKANESLQNNDLEYRIPFSAPTINGAFIATVTSLINKRGIRRKYAGFAGVLTPSHNMIQYYRLGNITYSLDDFAKLINQRRVTLDTTNPWKTASIDQYIDNWAIEGVLNPYVERYIDPNDIDLEDTVILVKKDTKSGEPKEHIIYVDSWAIYDYLKHNIDWSQFTAYNWTSRPKNLKQSNTFFKIQGSDKQYSVYDTDGVRVSHYLKNKPTDKEIELVKFTNSIDNVTANQVIIDTKNNFIKSVYGESTPDATLDYNKLAEDDIREIYKAIEEGREFKVSQVFNLDPNIKTVIASEYNVEPAEIIVGRMNASKFGLTEHDSLSKVMFEKETFFRNKLLDKFEFPDVDPNLYDFVLYTDTGEPILVKYGTNEEIQEQFAKIGGLSQDSSFKIVNDKVYYNDEEFISVNDKQFYTYTGSNEQKYNIITTNSLDRVSELKNSEIVDLTRTNYKSAKWRELAAYNQDELTKNPHFDYVKAIQAQFIREESKQLEYRINELAKRKYQAFEQSLYLVGARIPTQGMQSYMPMKVIMFTDSEVNDIYVPKAQTWLEGSDY